MIFTTYFAKINKLPKNIIPVSICGKAPDGYTGIQYKKLAPKYDFFMKWKVNHDDNYYIKHFQAEVLDVLSVARVLDELESLMPDEIRTQMQSPVYNNPDWHIALICYEKPFDFCHRHLVAGWLRNSGYECNEILL